ncbi:Chromatin structure-remodeling complex subunit rsc1 [Hypsizygus marmoreus]|uniref:Chromatin structure-remodeling complex subunit rsc1 n=1 Tax=Hypsizygus marmoreus TaxID=39966 RepID=A0A369JJ53_HYPMA|nr:Chromatin structure-remodeling complex subunit rsc1 [Hypsizygus marmoreus]
MPLTSIQSAAVTEVINAILATTGPKGKRQLAAMFLDLVDRTDWPQYYEVIPEPRCLNNIRLGVEKGRYKEALDVYTDLSLVFWNALFYNEPTSQIALDAKALKTVLEAEWKKRSVLPPARSSPPPSSAQKVHKVEEEQATIGNLPSLAPASAAPSTLAPPPVPSRTTTPATRSTPAPAASTSTFTYGKPIAIRPKSAQLSPEMDVDIMSPEPDGHGEGTIERDRESEEIVAQLEKGLPRWPGFGEEGWTQEASPERVNEVVHAVKGYKDVIGNRLATALEAVPEEPNNLYLSSTVPVSLKLIEHHARNKTYNSSKEFDMEMARLFEKARRWHKPGTEPYGSVLLLQRLYQALMSPTPPPGPPYHTTTNFAALRAGPGHVKPVHGAEGEGVPGVTTHRVLTKDRTFVDELHYKGWTVKLADWLHLANPDDPSRPIIAQVFRCWISDEPTKKGQPGLTVSWYYRPEQTFHPANRTFWEGEVFKTSHFADHPLDDIIEKIACQFTARHIRGRPRPPFWYLGFPLYVCDSRYNDRERVFVRIKNWNSCVPEEVRKSSEFMPIYPFERTVMPARLPSPFVGRQGARAVKGPGGLIPATGEGDDVGMGEGRKRTSRNGTGETSVGRYAGSAGSGFGVGAPQSSNLAVGASSYPSGLSQQYYPPQRTGPDRSVITAAGSMSNLQMEKLPPETAKHFDRDPDTNEVLWFPAPPVDVARPATARYSLEYLHFLAEKRKREIAAESASGEGKDAMDIDGEEESGHAQTKRPRKVPPTATETLRLALKAVPSVVV